MFRELAAGSLCAALTWTAASAAGNSVVLNNDFDTAVVQIPQGLSGFNDELQQLRDIRELARIGKKNPERTLHYFKRLGDVYRYSGFPEIGRTFKRIAPLMSRALRGPTKKGKTVSRGRGRHATRQLVQALADNQRVLPVFSRSYESPYALTSIGGKRTYPNYTGLALFFAGKLDRILERAAKGHKIARNLGAVPRKLWMTVRTDLRGEYLTAFNGPLVAQNTIWSGSVGVTMISGASLYDSATVILGAGGSISGTQDFYAGSAIMVSTQNTLAFSAENVLVHFTTGTLSIAANNENQLVALPPGEEVPGMSGVVSGTISGVEIPEGYTIHFVPAGSELPPDAIVLAAPGQSVTFE